MIHNIFSVFDADNVRYSVVSGSTNNEIDFKVYKAISYIFFRKVIIIII